MVTSSSQTMGLSPQAFSPTHGSTMLHSLVYIKNMHAPYKPIKFHPSKIYSEKWNWRATRIYNTQFHWIGRGHRGHAYLIENKRTSQGGPTGDERENRWESLVGYRRCGHLFFLKHERGVVPPMQPLLWSVLTQQKSHQKTSQLKRRRNKWNNIFFLSGK